MKANNRRVVPAAIAWLSVIFLLSPLLAAAVLPSVPARADVTTAAKDSLRTGWYPDQTLLTPDLLRGGTFGQQFSAAVDGQVYAQPLVANNTLLVATETNNVYGLSPATGARRWTRNLGAPWNPADLGCADLTPSIGVTGTPVVDAATGTMYLVSKTYVSGTTGAAAWSVHALDIATGAERPNFPVVIKGSASNDPSLVFNPTKQLQRPGLLLLNGVVYAAFGGLCDVGYFSGWVAGVSTLGQQTTLWSSTDRVGGEAGIWAPGGGLSSDGPGQILLATGNGEVAAVPTAGKTPPTALGQAVVRLAVQANGTLRPTDYFAPYDSALLNEWDGDLGSGGPLALPAQFGTAAHPHLLVEVGKQGYVYLLDREDLGGMGQGASGGDAVLDRVGPDGGVWGKPSAWPGDGGYVYIVTASPGSSAGASSGALHAYKYGVDGAGTPTLSLAGTSTAAFGLSSSSPVVTSSGTTSGSALVWTIFAPSGTGVGAQLRAYSPVPVDGVMPLVKTWPIGTSSKFNSPAVDNNHVYVGTRDGHVLGFGSPVTSPMTGAAVTWPVTTIGQSSVRTATLTANSALTVTAVATSSARFAAGASSPLLPATLAAGSALSIPVVFSPATVGQDSASLTVTTSIGSISLALTGAGQSASASITSAPTSISFGGVAVGSSATGSAIFSNTGATPLTIQSVSPPTAPFRVAGLPAPGSVLAPDTSVSAAVTFAPVANGSFTDQISLVTSAGIVSVPMSGSAAAPPHMVITPMTLAFGLMPIGVTASASFTISNTGGTPLTITKSKPPITGAGFTATTSLAEGTAIGPGVSVRETVQYAPTAGGAAADGWTLNGNDTSGVQTVKFTGSAGPALSIPSPTAGGWTLNGTAKLIGAGLQLTDASTARSAGSAFWPVAVDARYLDVSFDAAIDSGTGADGLTLALADPTRASATSLGVNGGGLGWAKIAGVAVALDTFAGGSDPSDNFVGLATGYQAANSSNLVWAATATAVPPLRNAIRHVHVIASGGQLVTFVDGNRVLRAPVTLGAKVLLGFTGADGYTTDRHTVSNVVIKTLSGLTAASAPSNVSGTAADGSAVVTWSAPADTGGAAIVSYTVTANPGGASKTVPATAQTATLSGLTNGSSYSFSVVATNSVGAGPPSASSAPVTPQAVITIPGPDAGGWRLNGSARLSGAALQLTNATSSFTAGSAFWPVAISGAATVTAAFTATIGGGTGADGMTLAFADASAGPTAIGANGGGLGWSRIPGFAVALDTHRNGTDPSNNFVGVATGFRAGAPDSPVWAATATTVPALRNTARRITITVAANVLNVSVDGTRVLSAAVTLPDRLLVGFTGANGGLTDLHSVSDVQIAVS